MNVFGFYNVYGKIPLSKINFNITKKRYCYKKQTIIDRKKTWFLVLVIFLLKKKYQLWTYACLQI